MQKNKDKKELKSLLTPQQVTEIKSKIASFDRFLKTHKQSIFKREREADESYARTEKKRYEKMLMERSAQPVDDKERNRIYHRVKYLESKIKENMPSRDEMMGKRGYRSDNPNKAYQEAIPSVVTKHIAWLKANDARLKEWKNLVRTLEPNDQNISNVERLRAIH